MTATLADFQDQLRQIKCAGELFDHWVNCVFATDAAFPNPNAYNLISDSSQDKLSQAAWKKCAAVEKFRQEFCFVILEWLHAALPSVLRVDAIMVATEYIRDNGQRLCEIIEQEPRGKPPKLIECMQCPDWQNLPELSAQYWTSFVAVRDRLTASSDQIGICALILIEVANLSLVADLSRILGADRAQALRDRLRSIPPVKLIQYIARDVRFHRSLLGQSFIGAFEGAVIRYLKTMEAQPAALPFSDFYLWLRNALQPWMDRELNADCADCGNSNFCKRHYYSKNPSRSDSRPLSQLSNPMQQPTRVVIVARARRRSAKTKNNRAAPSVNGEHEALLSRVRALLANNLRIPPNYATAVIEFFQKACQLHSSAEGWNVGKVITEIAARNDLTLDKLGNMINDVKQGLRDDDS